MRNTLLVVVALVILGVLGYVAYQKLYKTQMLPTTSAITTPSSKEDLNKELEKTVDDGGKADFDSLTQEASGL